RAERRGEGPPRRGGAGYRPTSVSNIDPFTPKGRTLSSWLAGLPTKSRTKPASVRREKSTCPHPPHRPISVVRLRRRLPAGRGPPRFDLLPTANALPRRQAIQGPSPGRGRGDRAPRPGRAAADRARQSERPAAGASSDTRS